MKLTAKANESLWQWSLQSNMFLMDYSLTDTSILSNMWTSSVCRLTLTTFGVYTSCSHLMFTQRRPPPAPFVKSEPELLPVPSEVVKHIPLQRCSTPLNQQFELWYSQLSWICENTSRRHRSDKGSRGREWRKSKNILIFSIKKCHLLQL